MAIPFCTDTVDSVGLGAGLGETLGGAGVLPHAQVATGDTVDYLSIAANPKASAHTPYAFRVLTPWLANEIGGVHHYRVAFRAITATALAGAGPAVYLGCRRLGGTHGAALTGMAGLMSLPMWLFNLYQPYLIDGPAMALAAWSMTALVYGWLAVLPRRCSWWPPVWPGRRSSASPYPCICGFGPAGWTCPRPGGWSCSCRRRCWRSGRCASRWRPTASRPRAS
ncbi:MAG TPA: hypothetical protein VFE14_07315 [Micromonosporaceae bacterium]|nr:hypothetical protein [Micromonosporaceae bacterium]